jgi:hypothetical protein
LPPVKTIETTTRHAEETVGLTPRATLSLTPTPVRDSPEADFGPTTSPKPVGGDAAPWDPYAAFIGIGREHGLRPRSNAPPTPVSLPKPRLLTTPVDASLTHETTLRLVSDLEEKVKSQVKSRPLPFARAPTNLYKDTVGISSSRFEDEVVVEDVKDDGSGDEERSFAHQYMKEDAATILELANEDDLIDSSSNAVADEDLRPRVPPSVSPIIRGADFTPSIAGAESLSEFQLVMESVFAEDDV